jgi:hypothetical protein
MGITFLLQRLHLELGSASRSLSKVVRLLAHWLVRNHGARDSRVFFCCDFPDGLEHALLFKRRPGRQSQAGYEGAALAELHEIFLGQTDSALELGRGITPVMFSPDQLKRAASLTEEEK